MQLMEIMAIRDQKEITRDRARARMGHEGEGTVTADPTAAAAGALHGDEAPPCED
jgi:hypothetical protein